MSGVNWQDKTESEVGPGETSFPSECECEVRSPLDDRARKDAEDDDMVNR
jgi:hypothetical protein